MSGDSYWFLLGMPLTACFHCASCPIRCICTLDTLQTCLEAACRFPLTHAPRACGWSLSTSMQSHLPFLRILVLVRCPYQNSQFFIPHVLVSEFGACCFHGLRPLLKTEMEVDTCCSAIASAAGVSWLVALVLPGVLLAVLETPAFRAPSV